MYLISSVFDFCCICTLSACVWQIRACRMQPFSLKERILLLHLFASHLMIIIISIVESKMIKEAVFVKKRIILEDGKNFQGHVKFGLCSDVHINYPLIMSKRRFHVMPFWWSELPFFLRHLIQIAPKKKNMDRRSEKSDYHYALRKVFSTSSLFIWK